jgi:phospholipase C
VLVSASLALSAPTAAFATPAPHISRITTSSPPISHVVIIDMENHSFDDMLGKFCVDQKVGQIVRAGVNDPCDGTNVGRLPDGSSYPLTLEQDHGLSIAHKVPFQQQAIDGGAMDGFANNPRCKASSSPAYACLSQYDPLAGTCGSSGTATCIPNVARLAQGFALSDRTFEFSTSTSWVGHMVLADATGQQFYGNNPVQGPLGTSPSPGWGCDSGKVTDWWDQGSQRLVSVPACIPNSAGSMGPIWDHTSYASGPHAGYAPTIFDRLHQAGVSWRIYGGTGGNWTQKGSGYGWTICPTFYECLGSRQHNKLVNNTQVQSDAQNGTLPGFSIVTPTFPNSQHPPASASQGDDWIGTVVNALMSGPEWNSTAIFITWDDCGCFYDHVNPLQYHVGWGVRVPMLIVSPYARAGYTDGTPTTFVSLLAFTEHLFGLSPLNSTDGSSYDLTGAFDFSQTPLPPITLTHTIVPRSTRTYVRKHLPGPNDPT